MEADFQQYYGLNIAEVDYGRMSRLLLQLPTSSRTFTKIKPELQWGWDQILANKTNYLLELLVWSKTEDATKKSPRNKPEPFIPDFIPKPKKHTDLVVSDIDDVKKILSGERKAL